MSQLGRLFSHLFKVMELFSAEKYFVKVRLTCNDDKAGLVEWPCELFAEAVWLNRVN